jgi:hypothetical protein
MRHATDDAEAGLETRRRVPRANRRRTLSDALLRVATQRRTLRVATQRRMLRVATQRRTWQQGQPSRCNGGERSATGPTPPHPTPTLRAPRPTPPLPYGPRSDPTPRTCSDAGALGAAEGLAAGCFDAAAAGAAVGSSSLLSAGGAAAAKSTRLWVGQRASRRSYLRARRHAQRRAVHLTYRLRAARATCRATPGVQRGTYDGGAAA